MTATTIRHDLHAERAGRCRLQLQDFSLGGLGAESSVRLKVNERVTLRLLTNGAHPAMELTGRVRHCRRQHGCYDVGIEFCETEAELARSPWRHLPRLFSIAARAS